MSKIEWHRPQDKTFEAGLDRGVIYVEDGPAVAWNGLSSVEDSGESEIQDYFLDGIKYLSTVSPRDWKGSLSAYTYPDEFAALIGIAELSDGLYVDSQAHGRFGLSYRTMISTPDYDGDRQHYKIHLVYKVMASLQGFTNETISADGTDPTQFEFELSAVPIKIPGQRPTAHIILDTRHMDELSLKNLEILLYGDETHDPAMPTIEQLVDLFKFAGAVLIVDNGDGSWTATGSNRNVRLTDEKGHFQIDNVAAEYLSEDVYRFLGMETVPTLALVADTDGVPYAVWTEGVSNTGLDSDGVPYFNVGAAGASIREDEDGTLYYDFN